MAKKKKSNTAMSDKVQVQNTSKKEDFLSRFVGYALLSLGAILIIVGIVLIVLYTRSPKLDEDMKVPSMDRIVSATKDEEVKIKGEVKDEKYVMIFVNEEVEDAKIEVNEDGEFEYVYEFSEEGEYIFEVASVRGFPMRYRSVKSSAQKIDVDWTAPSSKVDYDYDNEVEAGLFTFEGDFEEGVTVSLEQDGKIYSAKADKDGRVVIKDIPLNEGENVFSVSLKDDAGNTRKLSSKVSVVSEISAEDADVNGDAVTIGGKDLPEAAGELEAAIEYMFANKLMTTFGAVALMMFILSSSVVVKKMFA